MRKFVIFVCLCVLLLSSVQARGRGGGRSSGGRSRSSSGSRSYGSSTRRTSYRYGPYGSSSVTKYTPIPVRSSRTPVIRSQTKTLTRPNLNTRLLVAYLLLRYRLHSGPVYRERYPLYRGEVVIPEERAIRVNFTEEKLLDSNGSACLGPKDQRSLMADYVNRIVSVLTSVRYQGNDQGHKYYGDNRTLELDKAALDKSVQVTTIIKYNDSIIANTNCTQMKAVMNGTVVRLYATNPDGAGIVRSSLLVIFVATVLNFVYVLV